MAVAPRELQYEPVPELRLYLATTKALDERGRPIVEIKWYATKGWVQERGLVIPRSREWSNAREYFQEHNPEIAQDMITDPAEWTDSLLAHPRDGKYASNLNNKKLPKRGKGKYVLLIEGSTVEKRRNGNYVIDGGEVRELPDFPKQPGYLRESIPELGLVQGDSYLRTNSNFSYDEGLRPVFRGGRWDVLVRRFLADAYRWSSYSGSYMGFRPARRGLVETETKLKQKSIWSKFREMNMKVCEEIQIH